MGKPEMCTAEYDWYIDLQKTWKQVPKIMQTGFGDLQPQTRK